MNDFRYYYSVKIFQAPNGQNAENGGKFIHEGVRVKISANSKQLKHFQFPNFNFRLFLVLKNFNKKSFFQ